jgi:hypothetical protein
MTGLTVTEPVQKLVTTVMYVLTLPPAGKKLPAEI